MKKEDIQIIYDARTEVLIKMRLDGGHTNLKKYAELMGMDPSTYSNYETGVTISEANVFKIIDFNNITLGAFYDLVQVVMDRKHKN